MFNRKDLLSKRYEFLESLKVMADDKTWNRAARNVLGIFRGAPDGIKQLRKVLRKLPPLDFNILSQEKDVDNLFDECMLLLEKKQKCYEGFGKRLEVTQEFYRTAFADGLKIDNANHCRKTLSSE